MFAIKNLIEKSDSNTIVRLNKLNDMGVVLKLEQYLTMSRDTRPQEEYDSMS